MVTAVIALVATSPFDEALVLAPEMHSEIDEYRFDITRDDVTLAVEYCGNGPLRTRAAVRRIVFVIHGHGRNACGSASSVIASAELAGVVGETLVVAPHFPLAEDIDEDDDDLLYWSNDGWKEGGTSRSSPYDRPWAVSSFEVLDEMVRLAESAFGESTEIIVIGHSAGGQYTNRYAAGTQVARRARFVVANPSSYLYFDDRRWNGESFERPSRADRRECDTFDTYKYGTSDLVRYMEDVGARSLRDSYGTRRVIYLLGRVDTETDDALLDTSCAADWQGDNRLQRGLTYFSYLQTIYGPSIAARQSLVVVPDVGHDSRAMLASPAGQTAMFGS